MIIIRIQRALPSNKDLSEYITMANSGKQSYKAFNRYHDTEITNQNTALQYSSTLTNNKFTYPPIPDPIFLHTHTYIGTRKHISDGDGRTRGTDVKRFWAEHLKIKRTERF